MTNAPAFDTVKFNAVVLSKINLAIEAAWSNSQIETDLKAIDAQTFMALHSRQKSAKTVLVSPIEDPTKDYDVNVFFPDFCNWTAADCAQDICGVITGNQHGFKESPYKIQSCIEDSFEVSETQMAKTKLDIGAYIQMNFDRMIKNILEKLNAKAVAFLGAAAGFNKDATPYAINAGTGLTEVPAANFTPDLMVDMLLDAKLSRIVQPFLIDGRNLYKVATNALLNGANAEGKGDAARLQLLNIESDPVGFAQAGKDTLTYMVSPGAYAFATKNYVGSTVPTYDADLRKTIYRLNVPAMGFDLDVYHQRVCEDSATGRMKHVFLVKLWYDFLENPNGCADENGKQVSGIIGYKKVA